MCYIAGQKKEKKKDEVMIKAYHIKTYHCMPLVYIWNLILVGEMTK